LIAGFILVDCSDTEIYDSDDARRSALTNWAFALVFATIGLIVAGVAVGGFFGFACLMGALALGLPLSSVVQARERLEEREAAERPSRPLAEASGPTLFDAPDRADGRSWAELERERAAAARPVAERRRA
jgi:hypothetical protein